MEPTEQGILLEVLNSGIGGSFLIGVTTDEGETADAVITVERTSDPSLDIAEIPWIDCEPTKAPVAIDLAGEGEVAVLTDLDITNPNLTVVLGADGFYHLGTADGAIVYLRIGTASAYLDSFYDICSVSRFGAYFYNEDGSFDRKESYNLLIEAYYACADAETGLYPLTEDLAYVIQVMGEYYGWWTASDSIFGTTPFVPSVAWLFACVTVEVVKENG